MALLDADWDPGFPFTAFPRVHIHFEADRKFDKIATYFCAVPKLKNEIYWNDQISGTDIYNRSAYNSGQTMQNST